MWEVFYIIMFLKELNFNNFKQYLWLTIINHNSQQSTTTINSFVRSHFFLKISLKYFHTLQNNTVMFFLFLFFMDYEIMTYIKITNKSFKKSFFVKRPFFFLERQESFWVFLYVKRLWSIDKLKSWGSKRVDSASYLWSYKLLKEWVIILNVNEILLC